MFLASLGLITSLNDISDGLASEISEIAKASQVGAKIIAEQIPLSEDVKNLAQEMGKDPLNWALYGGEDYHLIFTCHDQDCEIIKKMFRKKFKKELYKIGYIVPLEEGISLQKRGLTEPIIRKGYNHF